MSRGRVVAYSSSPLLASRTPVWRSKLIVGAVALGFLGLAGRAAWIQVFGNAFYIKQGEVRFARTLELPANRGRILDRNGLLLATSVPVPSIWAMPEEVDRDDAKLGELAKLLDMPLAALKKRLGDDDRSFVWLKREVDESAAREIAALDIKGIYQRKEYRRQYPEGEAAAHIVGFTNADDKGQEGVELASEQQLAGRPGSRRNPCRFLPSSRNIGASTRKCPRSCASIRSRPPPTSSVPLPGVPPYASVAAKRTTRRSSAMSMTWPRSNRRSSSSPAFPLCSTTHSSPTAIAAAGVLPH